MLVHSDSLQRADGAFLLVLALQRQNTCPQRSMSAAASVQTMPLYL